VLDQPIAAPPNTVWAYSSASVDLLSYAVEGATGDTLAAFFAEEIAAPLGMKPFVWQSMGEHTVASAYAYLAPRELARVGYLMLREGRWGAGPAWQQVVSAERITAMTTWAEELGSTTFQEPSFFTNDPESHLRYGELVWTNHVENGFVGQHLPADAWYMAGYATNLCLVVPSLDLVVVRLGKGPKPWDDALVAAFGDAIAEAVVSDPLPYASASPMGPSCGGPSLASSSPALGGTLSLRTQGLAPGGVAFLILGDALASGIPLGEGCPLIVAPSTALVLPPLSADASGEVLLSLPLSADPSTAGSSVAIQVLGWPGTTLFDFSLSNGVMLWIGS
jgi:hypothetical protein